MTFNSLNLSNLDDIKTVDVKTGHDYETKYASKTDGTVTQTCKSCGYVNKFTVPTSTTVYWRTDLSNTSFSSVLSKTQFSVGDSIDFWLYDDTDYTVEFSDRSMVSVNKLENYANDIRRITFKNGGSLTVKIYPTYNPSVAKTYKFTCGCTSHTYGNAVITKQPTCTSEGTKTKTCTKCNATVTETIPKTSHKYANTVVAPTCTTDGYTLHKCSACGTSYKDNTTKATGHSYGNSVVTKQPTCTSEGTAIKTCTKCNATVTEKLPAKGHTAVIDKGYPATCTTAGKTDGSHCSVCNTVIKVQTVINATGHKSSGWIVDKTASIGVKGSKHKECTVCKKVLETAEIPALSRISISKASVTLSTSTYAYDGKAKKPGVTVKLNGKTLKNGTDYSVTYSNNTKVGTAKVTIKGKGNYSGTVTKTFKINPAKQEIQKLTAKSKAFFVDWAQKGSATGYEIQYATNSKFTSAKKVTITNKKTDKTTVSKLSGKKKYYVRVRSYTTVKGTKYYGAWSASKSVTTKK